MSKYADVIEVIARNATIAIELGGLSREDALDLAARKSVEAARDARTRTGVYAHETTSETIEEVRFYGAVARDILDGDISCPSVGNVRQAALDKLDELGG